MKNRSLSVGLLLLVFGLVGAMFVQVIWIPLYWQSETERFVASQETPAVQVDVERDEPQGKKTWSIADPKAMSTLKAGLQSAEAAPATPPASASPSPDQKYRLKIRRTDSRVDEYEVVLGSEGRSQDRLIVVRRSGGAPVYGTAFNTPELRSALQQVLVPPSAPK